MKTFFKVVIWIAAVLLGLFVWNVLPDFRPLVVVDSGRNVRLLRVVDHC